MIRRVHRKLIQPRNVSVMVGILVVVNYVNAWLVKERFVLAEVVAGYDLSQYHHHRRPNRQLRKKSIAV